MVAPVIEPLRHAGNSANIDFYDPADDAQRRAPYLAVEVLRNDLDRVDGKVALRETPVYYLTVRRYTDRGNRELRRCSYVADPPVRTGTVLDPEVVREIANAALAGAGR